MQLSRRHGDQVRLLHRLQGRLVPTEDLVQEHIIRHTAFLRRVGEQFHRAPELWPRPLRALLAAQQQVPHRALGPVGEPLDGLGGRRAPVDLLGQRRDVPEPAADAGDLPVCQLHGAVVRAEVPLEHPAQSRGATVVQLADLQALGPVAQRRQHGRLGEGGIRDEQDSGEVLLGNVRRPRHQAVEEALAPRLVLGREAVDDDEGHAGRRVLLPLVDFLAPVAPPREGGRDARQDALDRDEELVLAAELAGSGQDQVQQSGHLSIHALRRPITEGFAKMLQKYPVVERSPRF
mmetsp:Transcript_94941/g.290426  ORF Transcript_94941/g.290426 Transcript_94941/m.290426 type:complete len:291 (-) Transcript_94941:293-1165(-)